MSALESIAIPSGRPAVLRAFAAGTRPAPRMTVSEWADADRRLPSKGASEPGRWRTDRVPFIRELMDCLSAHHPARRVVFMKSTQVAGTEAGNNWVGYVVARMRVPMMVVQPTIELAERWSKHRLAGMIEDTPVLRAKIAPARSRDSGNTTLLKEWPGGVLIVSGANSGASLRSMPARYVFADEVDAYPIDLDGEGDPLTLAEARTSTFPDRKVFICSTPTIKSLSVIDKEYAQSDQRRYHVPCPECGHRQPLEWEQLYWPERRPAEARYLCIECGAGIAEAHKARILAEGTWVAAFPEREIIGFHINALYTPPGLGLSWGELAELYERVKADPVRLKTFTNTKLGICNEDPEERVDWEEVKARAEPYALRTIPPGCLVLTAGCDVQKDRWEVLVLGHGPGGEQWVIDYAVIEGDPTQPKDWAQLEAYFAEPITNHRGIPLRIQAMTIDSGYQQDDVINFTRGREPRGIYAIKGSSTPGRPIIGTATKVDVNWRGSVLKGGGRLWMVGSDTAKTRLLDQYLVPDRRAVTPAGRRLHFPTGLDDSFYVGLTAEVYDPNKRHWIKIRQRNEPLDCWAYAMAAAMHPRMPYRGLHRWGEHHWAQVRAAVEPEGDLFAAPADQRTPERAPTSPAPESEDDDQTPRRRAARSFVRGWRP